MRKYPVRFGKESKQVPLEGSLDLVHLSIGAVFGVYAGYYHYSPLIFGYLYQEYLAQIHFWLSFFGVLILFVPQHFLGINGMPRRIPDYPDAFSGWNLVSSSGSFIMLISVILFMYIIYDQLASKRETSFDYYSNLEFFPTNYEPIHNFKSLEHVLPYPAKAHSFDVLPAQTI